MVPSWNFSRNQYNQLQLLIHESKKEKKGNKKK